MEVDEKGEGTYRLGWLEDGGHANGLLEKQVIRMHVCVDGWVIGGD